MEIGVTQILHIKFGFCLKIKVDVSKLLMGSVVARKYGNWGYLNNSYQIWILFKNKSSCPL